MADTRPSAMEPSFAGRDFLVVGNGPSMADADPWRIDLGDAIIRVNNFFFEETYQFGRRVDLVQIGGDRWVFPFYGRTLSKLQASGTYDIGAWSCHQPHVAASARRLLPMPETAFAYRNPDLRAQILALAAAHGKTPTTGIQAVLNAHALGARSITLIGVDFYERERRYGHEPGRHAQDLLRQAGGSGYNQRFHSRELDVEILDLLQRRDELKLYRAVDNPSPALAGLDLAPRRERPAVLGSAKDVQTPDWEAWAGPYPIGLMKVLRRSRELQKAVFRRR